MNRSACLYLLLVAGAFSARAGEPNEPVYDPAIRTYTLTEPPDDRRTAPTFPMQYREAFRHWDGTGELLLAPDDGEEPDAMFGMGATFNNSDATADERASDGIDLRCPALEATYRIQNGRFSVSQGAFPRSPQAARVTTSADRRGLTFFTDLCRYHLALIMKLRLNGQWADAPAAPPPAPIAPPESPGRRIRMKQGGTFVMKAAPFPQELSASRATSVTGTRLEGGTAEACPKPSGTIDFEPRGVFLSQTWPSASSYTPGVLRDVDARETRLIFQTPTCREEIGVTREVRIDGAWQASPLSRASKDVEPTEAK